MGVVFDGAGSLEKRASDQVEVNFAIRSMPGTFRDLDRDFRYDAPGEKRQDFNLAAAVTASVEAQPGGDEQEDEAPEMRAFVVTDSAAFTDLPMSRFMGNQVLFVDAVRWLAGEESIMGELSSEEDLRIEHTKQEDLVWFYSTIIGAPALVLGLGFWLARRPTRRSSKKKGAKQ
jgi:hypothetical protein